MPHMVSDSGSNVDALCANIDETSCVIAISEQGGKDTQHGNDERQCSPGVTRDGDIRFPNTGCRPKHRDGCGSW